MSAPPALSVDNVSFAYDERRVLRDVTLAVPQGAFLGLIGPNGSGKTTLLHLMLGLKKPDTGTVNLFGQSPEAFTDGTRLSYVSQQSTRAADAMPVTVRELVRMGRYPHASIRRLSSEDTAAVDRALEQVGITDLADRQLRQLSGGQRQRAYIARALAGDAELLALDEPTVGVDAASIDEFYHLLETLHEGGITIVLIEHDIGRVTQHATAIACLNEELYEHCPTEEFLQTDALARAFSSARVVAEHSQGV